MSQPHASTPHAVADSMDPAWQEAWHAAERRLAETAGQVVRLLATDLAIYPERELRQRFVASAAADALDDAHLAPLRWQARLLGQDAAARLQARLGTLPPWLALVGHVPEGRKTLQDLAPIWQEIAWVDTELESLAATVGLAAEDGQAAGYRLPARFIDAQHLPNLTDKLWKILHEMATLDGHRQVTRAEQTRVARAQRWDAA